MYIFVCLILVGDLGWLLVLFVVFGSCLLYVVIITRWVVCFVVSLVGWLFGCLLFGLFLWLVVILVCAFLLFGEVAWVCFVVLFV